MAGRPPNLDPLVYSINDLKVYGSRNLDKMYSDYFNEGAMDLLTMHDNEAAFDRYRIRPRILTNVETIDTSSSIFGSPVSFPFGFAPSAMHGLANPIGEVGTAGAAGKKGIAMSLAQYSNCTLEDVAKAGNAACIGQHQIPYAFQMCIPRDKSLTEALLQRAEAAGFKALLVSVDCPYLGRRLNEHRNNFTLPKGLVWGNLFPPGAAIDMTKMGDSLTYDTTLDWSVIPWLRERTKMQIWLKGVLSPEDVVLAIRHKCDGVIISNHGGRQLDGVPASLDALRECAPVAVGRISIGVDGGIRRGSDIFKAIAMGADFCLAGRIPIWGLAYKGQEGVELAIEILRQEFATTMALAGCRSVSEIGRQHLSVINGEGRLSKL